MCLYRCSRHALESVCSCCNTVIAVLIAEESDAEETLDRRRSTEPGEQPSAHDLEAADALAFNRKPPGRLAMGSQDKSGMQTGIASTLGGI